MEGEGGWCTIESDPGVFSELIRDIGVKGAQVEELYDLDPQNFARLKPLFGLIFLFKWRPGETDPPRPVQRETPPGLFFANQVINNACATQAILAILMNCPHIELGPALTGFRDATADFDSEMKGLAISNVEVIRTAHNSFARPEPFVLESKKASKDDDLYHFISYIPYGGAVWELDGLKAGPVNLGAAPEESWLTIATPEIQRRIDRYSSQEIRFNVMAVIQDRRALYAETLATTLGCIPMEVGDAPVPATANYEEVARLKDLLQQEDERWAMWRVENIRRRHNYVPFIINMLKVLGRKGQLKPLIEKARAKQLARSNST